MLDQSTIALFIIAVLVGIIILILLLLFICKKSDMEQPYSQECKNVRVLQSINITIDGEKTFEIIGMIEKQYHSETNRKIEGDECKKQEGNNDEEKNDNANQKVDCQDDQNNHENVEQGDVVQDNRHNNDKQNESNQQEN